MNEQAASSPESSAHRTSSESQASPVTSEQLKDYLAAKLEIARQMPNLTEDDRAEQIAAIAQAQAFLEAHPGDDAEAVQALIGNNPEMPLAEILKHMVEDPSAAAAQIALEQRTLELIKEQAAHPEPPQNERVQAARQLVDDTPTIGAQPGPARDPKAEAARVNDERWYDSQR